MKTWSLFFISIGCIFIMMSYQMPNPIYLILSGLVLVGFGVYQLRKKDSKRNRK